MESKKKNCFENKMTKKVMFFYLRIAHSYYNQGIFVYNPFPCIFATKARMNLILVSMDSYWSSLTIDTSISKIRQEVM